MRSLHGRALAVVLTIVLGLGLTSLALVPAAAAPSPKLKVLTDSARVKDFTVPVKVRCKAAASKRCKGTLKLVLEGQGSPKRAYNVRGGKRAVVRLPISAAQLEILFVAGTADGVVRVKERKPRRLDSRTSPISVKAPR